MHLKIEYLRLKYILKAVICLLFKNLFVQIHFNHSSIPCYSIFSSIYITETVRNSLPDNHSADRCM